MKKTKDEKRKLLKEAGWRRQDRTSQGVHYEYWADPQPDKLGFVRLVSLDAAFRKYLKQNTTY